jgi:biotin-dependent carboxylase-like uncharacterized protein
MLPRDGQPSPMIEVVATGPQATVQDLGRVGFAAWGIPSGGAADRGSLRLANRLVGNCEDAAAFEVLLGGLTLRFDRAATIALTGATCEYTVGRLPGRVNGPQYVPAGALVTVAPPPVQLRTYIAVRGGLATEVMLGSRSSDERSGLLRALRPGDRVPVGAEVIGPPLVDIAPLPAQPVGPLVLDAVLGPRDDWFTPESLVRFGSYTYLIDAASDRIGIRLTGPALHRRTGAELLSEPTMRGAIEVPPDGQPIIFSADHPTTCGYPVIAVLEPHSADAVSQARPGEAVTIRLIRSTRQ